MARTPAVGKLAPDFELPDSTGVSQQLADLISRDRLVLLFYRGSW